MENIIAQSIQNSNSTISLITIMVLALIAVAAVIKLMCDSIHIIHCEIEAHMQPVRDFARTAEHLAQKVKEKCTR